MTSFKIPKTHPRYESLIKREKIIDGFKEGIVAHAGLIAHGRGEAFDYLLGEKTNEFSRIAEKAAVAKILLSENPVFSVNGNVAALAADEVIELAKRLNMKVEANLFYRTEERIKKIVDLFRERGLEILGENPDARIKGLDHARALCTYEGIYSADTVLIPLEDGDRTKALREMGKYVITIDLNPMSRTATTANITIVDELTRALKNMIELTDMNRETAKEILLHYDNEQIIRDSLTFMSERLHELGSEKIP